MPAVRVDLGYMSNIDDSKRLQSENFQDAIAQGVAAAVTAFCAPR
jgi:N-acetylmuramoyl-L-alanine amidase